MCSHKVEKRLLLWTTHSRYKESSRVWEIQKCNSWMLSAKLFNLMHLFSELEWLQFISVRINRRLQATHVLDCKRMLSSLESNKDEKGNTIKVYYAGQLRHFN